MESARAPGSLIFAIVFLILSVGLLAQIENQTTWSNRHALTSQPRFWPAVSLGGMAVFAICVLALGIISAEDIDLLR